jgi:hypothetical protein
MNAIAASTKIFATGKKQVLPLRQAQGQDDNFVIWSAG